MGLAQSATNQVRQNLTTADFNSACDSAYSHCLSLTQHAFNGVLPYQLVTAAAHLHHTLTSLHPSPLIRRWVPSPPTNSQVDSAFRSVTAHHQKPEAQDELVLGPTQFKEWAVVVFTDAVVGNAGKALMTRVPIGIAGIAGIGAVARPGKPVIGTLIGVYALGVATSIYIGLSG